MELALLGGAPVRQKPFPIWPDYGDAERESLLEVLHSGSWGGYNRKVSEFEGMFATLHGVNHAVSCANGTVALEVALRSLGIRCGDEVIVPAITFVSTATSVLLCHGVPVFVDIDPLTLNLLPDAVEAAVTPRAKAIVAVHFGGHPADMDRLPEIARRHGLALIEDAAHAPGGAWRGVPVGNFGDAATFSFQAFKLVTSGEGGVLLTNSSDLAERMWSYCNQGRRKSGGWFEHFTLGSNYRITGFQAALLCAQLQKLPQQIETRSQNVGYLRRLLTDFPGLALPQDDSRVSRHPYYLLTLRYDKSAFGGLPRDVFLRAVQAEGIPALPTYPHPLYLNPVFHEEALPPCRCAQWKAAQNYQALSLPESERICKTGIWLEHNLFLGGRTDMEDILAAFDKVRRQADSLRSFSSASGISSE